MSGGQTTANTQHSASGEAGTDVERRQLSSQWTFFYKFVFPTCWIAIMGIGTLVDWIRLLVPGPLPGVAYAELAFLAVWISLAAWMIWRLGPLKRVTLCGDCLIVSNFRREESIPLQGIRSVEGSRFISPERVRLRLRYTSGFGDTIVFMPIARATLTLTNHPIVAELEQLVATCANRT